MKFSGYKISLKDSYSLLDFGLTVESFINDSLENDYRLANISAIAISQALFSIEVAKTKQGKNSYKDYIKRTEKLILESYEDKDIIIARRNEFLEKAAKIGENLPWQKMSYILK